MNRWPQTLLMGLAACLPVFAQEIPADAAVAAPGAPTPVERRDAIQTQFLSLTDQKRYDEAIALATQVLDLTIQIYGEKSIEIATPLSNLATAQMHNGDLTGAETNYKAAIDLIEKAVGILSPRLVNPLIGLGATYYRAGLYPQSMQAYERALRVNHAEQGFYNTDQLKIRDGLTETYLGMDKMEDANFQQQVQLNIQRRKFGRNSAELVPAIEKLARWYDRTGQYPDAQLQWQSARRILRQTKGPQDPALADVLIGEAKSYESQALLPIAVSALQDAIEILEAQPARDHRKYAETLVALGDLYLAYGKPKSARQQYSAAWSDLSGSDELRAERDGYFARPRRISGRLLDKVAGSDGDTSAPSAPDTLLPGYVVANITVDEDGRVIDPKVIESDPPGLMDAQVLSVLASSRFRPRMSDGVVVASPDVAFRHDYRYAKGLVATRGDDDGIKSDNKGKPIAYPQAEPAQPTAPEPQGD
jgi:tetratricopeptide (TPR) repeat protein